MLTNIRISDYALISHLDIDFRNGFSVITGETGAGKSIILGALGLVMGNRADSKAIRDGAKKCVVEVNFDISGYGLESFFELNDLDYADQCTIRREVSNNGKSRTFVNDTPVNLPTLKELSNRLIDIHSQHENLQLGNDDFQRNIIDNVAGNKALRDDYTAKYNEYVKAQKVLAELIAKAEKEKNDQDYLAFQFQQLDEAKLKAGEDLELEAEIATLSHAEEIKSQLSDCVNCLTNEQGTINLLREAEQNLNKAVRYNTELQELLQRLHSTIIEIKDISDSVETIERNTDYDPQRLQEAEERFDLLNTLMSKHHVQTIAELIDIRDQLKEHLNQINSYDEQINQAQQHFEKCKIDLDKTAQQLTASRVAVTDKAETEITDKLLQLGIKHAQFEIHIDHLEHFTPHGIDNISFLFAANKNQQLQDVSSVASGGEIARIMLAVKSLTASQNSPQSLPTLLFDEIDTGVSGEIADSMGKIMKAMSHNRQIISITHLPQIAARGEVHYKVYKQDNEQSTETHISKLTDEQRINEIAAMMSGNQISAAAIENAKELLKS